MAYTVTRDHFSNGNKKGVILNITADAASATVQVGLGTIDGFSVGIQSANSSNFVLRANATAAGTATAGSLGISGCTSGDAFFVTVIGH